ncbi:MAG: glycosyltransferase [Muribaculaceae bacterium]|nr:glycosyltransferase [Muribaculaceae bacterium]
MDKTLTIVCGPLVSGGAERVISILLNPFVEEYKTVNLIKWNQGKDFYEINPKVNVIDFTSYSKSNNIFKKIFKFPSLIKSLHTDIIISFLTPYSLLVLISIIFTKYKIIVAERLDPRLLPGGDIMRTIRNILFRRANGILCQTNFIKELYPRYLRKKIKVIYNPIILSKELIGSALNVNKENKIVAIGRLHPQKNYNLLIEGFSLFNKINPNYKVEIYGDGVLKDKIQNQIDSKNLHNKIIIKKPTKNVHSEILDAKLFLMTSDYEGMSNALIEAMCLGLPVVSTKVSGATDLIKNKKNGILIDSNPNDLYEAMKYIITNETVQTEFGKEGAKLYHQLEVKKISKEWIDYINSFIS